MKENLFGNIINRLTSVFFLAFAILLVLTSHGDIVLWVNVRHTPVLDQLFKYWTYLGDGLLLGIFGLILLLTNYYRVLTFLVGVALQTIFVHIFKQWLYAGEPRPKVFFQDALETLNFVEGVTVRGYDSFPSGHTASGFILFYFIITIVKNEALRALCFITALGVGFSRIYLLQHFARDVFFGGLFGVISVILAYAIMKKYEDRPRLQRGLLFR